MPVKNQLVRGSGILLVISSLLSNYARQVWGAGAPVHPISGKVPLSLEPMFY